MGNRGDYFRLFLWVLRFFINHLCLLYLKMNFMGTVFLHIENILNEYQYYKLFRYGEISREEYYTYLIAHEPELRSKDLTEDQIHLSSRFPLNEAQFVDEILAELKNQGVIKTTEYSKKAFSEYRKTIYSNYNHGKYYTFIFPEEERIMYALTQIVKPSTVILLGSYYGYWGIWAMPAVKEVGGLAYFVDLNDDVNKIANINLQNFGYQGHFEVITQEGVDFMKQKKTRYDLAVLDAEGNANHPNSDYRGKAVYYPLIKEGIKHIYNGGFALCHNILLKNFLADPYFKLKIAKNLREYEKFLPFVKENFPFALEYNTTEGIGVYKRA